MTQVLEVTSTRDDGVPRDGNNSINHSLRNVL